MNPPVKRRPSKRERLLASPVTLAELQTVLSDAKQAFRSLSWSAGDVPEWNEGGEAYEASQAVTLIRERLEQAGLAAACVQASKAALTADEHINP